MVAELAECVVNVSEGRDRAELKRLASSCGELLLDLHLDPDHHRAVLTLAGEDAPLLEATLTLCREAVGHLTIADHQGVHPRLGVVDVVPFVALGGRPIEDAVALREAFARRAAEELALPVFCYGPVNGGQRSLPELRRRAFSGLTPDHGPRFPHPTAGAVCAGARGLLVAWNLVAEGLELAEVAEVAASLRREGLRTMAFGVSAGPQVSCNLVDPLHLGPAEAYDLIAEALRARGGAPGSAELVGLVPEAVLTATDPGRWAQLGLSPEASIEGRLAARGLRPS